MRYSPGDTLLDIYSIEGIVGIGEFAEVYQARYTKLNAPCALKIVHTDTPGVDAAVFASCHTRFCMETKFGDLIRHPNLVRVYDNMRKDDMLILVIEYTAGGSLADRLEKCRKENQYITIDNAMHIIHDIGEGLGAVHALDAVHRNVKPSNILFDAEGTPKIADLGFAQISTEASLRSELTQEKKAVKKESEKPEGGAEVREAPPHPGTPAYMSPEQRDTTDALVPASDVYSLGLVAFEILTNQSYNDLPPETSVQSLRPEVPSWLSDLVARMLSPEPDDRPYSGSDVAGLIRDGVRLENDEQLSASFKPTETQKKKITIFGNAMVISITAGVELSLTRIPAGEFIMGSNKAKDPEANENECPQHRVFLEPYWISKKLITNAQYKGFVKATGHPPPAHWENGEIPRGKERHPVVNVSWDDAIEFCRWASKLSELIIRLPTEAEWEKAARGTDGRLYPWGNQPPDPKLANFDMNLGDTTPVGKFSPKGDSPYGCADMAGNVWEWTGSLFRAYPYNPEDGRESLHNPKARVLRGGAYTNYRRLIACPNRSWSLPNVKHGLCGFRVCLTPLT